jgi:8-oxo-dGTP diphosphatase
MHLIKKSAIAIIRNNKILMVRERGENYYKTLGGKPEGNESFEEALEREIMEEIGCKIDANSIKFYGKFEDVAASDPDAIVQISMFRGEITGEPAPSGEIEEIVWIDSTCKPELLSPIMNNRIIPALLKDGLIE